MEAVSISITVAICLEYFSEKLSQNIPTQQRTKFCASSNVGDGRDLLLGDVAGVANRFFRQRLTNEELLRLPQSNDVRPHAAVGDARFGNRSSAHAHPDCRGEGADVQILSLGHLVQLEDVG